MLQVNEALTALQFDDTGLKCAVGTHNGQIAIYDLRSSRPLVQKDHMYSSPILSLAFFSTDFTGGDSLLLLKVLTIDLGNSI